MSALFIIGYFATLYVVLSGEIRVPVDFKEIALTLIGALTVNVGQIVTTWMRREPVP